MIKVSAMFYLTIIFFLFSAANGARDADLILDLPGLNYAVSYNQYSGYLNASDTQFLHYWFIESQNDPANDPVVLWLNGGPGCSSMYGLLMEHGPFLINDDGTELIENPYSWNMVANMLYLESPAGVGYSYSTDKTSTSDDDTANQNYNALIDFFTGFPEFSSNEFFITGESYAGFYVPTLSVRVAQGSYPMNFKGFAVGNAISSYPMNDNSIVYFAYYHGLFGDEMWEEMVNFCCEGNAVYPQNCKFNDPPNPACQTRVAEVNYILWFSGLNMYSLYADCLESSYSYYNTAMNNLFLNLDEEVRRNITKSLPHKYAGDTRGAAPCLDDDGEYIWLNSPEVRQALHISDLANEEWEMCTSLQYIRQYETMEEQYQTLLDGNYRALLYNGDTDLACNFMGDQWFVNELHRNETAPRRQWEHGGQVAGYVHDYEGITFLDILGAGHMVPEDEPELALIMFAKFLANEPYP